MLTPEQSALPLDMTQLRAAAVNCLTSCRCRVPLTLTQIASTAESQEPTDVSSMVSPQTVKEPTLLITAWVMFWLLPFSIPACVPQKPGVLHISSLVGVHLHTSGFGAEVTLSGLLQRLLVPVAVKVLDGNCAPSTGQSHVPLQVTHSPLARTNGKALSQVN